MRLTFQRVTGVQLPKNGGSGGFQPGGLVHFARSGCLGWFFLEPVLSEALT
jgi:hypothetical protein